MLFQYPIDHPILMRALEIEQVSDIKALGTYEARQTALYMAMSEATGRDPKSVTLRGSSSLLNRHHVIEEMRKETGLDYVTMSDFCGASFREKREREESA